LRAVSATGLTALHVAASRGQAAVVEELLEMGADARRPAAGAGELAIYMAANAGLVATVDVLLRDATEYSAMELQRTAAIAALSGHAEVFRLQYTRQLEGQLVVSSISIICWRT